MRKDNTLNAYSDIIEVVLTKIMIYSRNIVMLYDIDSVLAVCIYDYVIVTNKLKDNDFRHFQVVNM